MANTLSPRAPGPRVSPLLLVFTFVAATASVHCAGEGGSRPSAAPSAPEATTASSVASVASAAEPAPSVELVESFPRGTTLDHADIPDASDVWPAMIDAAKTRIDFAHFYASLKAGSRLEKTVEALERAAARGVAIRIVLDEGFSQKYPEGRDRLKAMPGAVLHTIDLSARTGGVHHAKYFIVDDREAYLGSQNFDWRSLEHIQELGVRTSSKSTVAMLRAVFETDFSGVAADGTLRRELGPSESILYGTETTRITPAASPEALGPASASWDLPAILNELESARRSIRVQVLTFRPGNRTGEHWTRLDGALRRAKARGVTVRLLVADWSMRVGSQEGLDDLATRGGVEIKVVTIPEDKEGPIPYARVVHAKYMVVDGEHAWLGTSNWEYDYFYATRNVAVFLDGKSVATRMEGFFDDLWNSPYAVAIAEAKHATPPDVPKKKTKKP